MELLMSFINQSHSFTIGFEAGTVFELSKQGKPFDNYIFHVENTKQIEMILKLHGYDYSIEIIDNNWSAILGSNKAELN